MRSLFLVLVIFIFQAGFAGNIAGGNITYRAIDSVNDEVTVRIFTACDTTSKAPHDTLSVSWQGGGYTTNMQLISSTDVTGTFNKCSTKSKCAGGSFSGYNEYLYRASVNISGSACKVTFSWQGDSRMDAISVGHANTTFYIFAELNKCFGINNSAHTTLPPQLITPLGQDINLTQGIIDTTDGDSVHFEMVAAQHGPGQDVSYYGNYSPGAPLYYLGMPNRNLTFPGGFHFDSTTAEISFRPTKSSEISVITIAAHEYRKINGKMEEIGRTRYEHSLQVLNTSPNKVPKTGIRYSSVCVGQQPCFSITSSDDDADDTTRLSWNKALSGATFVTTGAQREGATFCWTPEEKDIRNWPYQFTVEAVDDGCSPNWRYRRTFLIQVYPKMDSSYLRYETKQLDCNRLRIKMKKPLTAQLKREITSSDAIMGFSSTDSAELYFNKNGWNKYVIKISNAGCSLSFTDSVFIQPPYQLRFSVTDTSVCQSNPVFVSAAPLNGKAPFGYKWSNNATTAGFTHTVKANTTFVLFAYDSSGCIAVDTARINLHSLGTVKFTYPASICGNTPAFRLSALPAGGRWAVSQGFVPPDSIYPEAFWPGTYYLQYVANDSNNCEITAQSQLIIRPFAKANFTADITKALVPPLTVTFTNLSAPNPDSVFWLFTGPAASPSLTSNDTQPRFTCTNYGKYDVSLRTSLGGCHDSVTKKGYITIGNVGASSPSPSPLKVYPNPARESIYMEAGEETIRTVWVTDVSGRKATGAGVAGNPFNVGNLATGVYFIYAETQEGNLYHAKIVVE